MAKKETGRDYELIVKAIYEALLSQHELTNLDLNHNVKVRGLTATHQIDVRWKFWHADTVYDTIVQVKKQKSRASLGDIMLFGGVLDDIPGQPRGIFITRAGFQKGALNCARERGINLVQLSELVKPPPFKMTTMSTARLEIVPDTLTLKVTVTTLKLSNISIVFDREWVSANVPTPLLEAMIQSSFRFRGDTITFQSEKNQTLSTLRERISVFVNDHPMGGDLRLEFSEPTFMSGNPEVEPIFQLSKNIKIVSLGVTVDVVKEVSESAFTANAFTSYVMTNVLDNTKRFVLVGGSENAPRAITSLAKKKLT